MISHTSQQHLQSNVKLPSSLDLTVFLESKDYDIHPFVTAGSLPFDLDDIGYPIAGIHRPSRLIPLLSAAPTPAPAPSPAGSTGSA